MTDTELIPIYLDLVGIWKTRYTFPGYDASDIAQESWIIMRAIADKYDATRGSPKSFFNKAVSRRLLNLRRDRLARTVDLTFLGDVDFADEPEEKTTDEYRDTIIERVRSRLSRTWKERLDKWLADPSTITASQTYKLHAQIREVAQKIEMEPPPFDDDKMRPILEAIDGVQFTKSEMYALVYRIEEQTRD